MTFAPKHDNLVTMFRESVERFGSKPLFGIRSKEGGDWRWVTYAEFGKLVDDARGGLAALGVGPKDRVAVISNNRLEWAVCCYATQGLGATYVPMYENQLCLLYTSPSPRDS